MDVTDGPARPVNPWAARLESPVTVIQSVASQRPMIIMGSHNPNILTEYVVDVRLPERTPEDHDSVPPLPEEQKERYLQAIEIAQKSAHEFLWDRVLPVLLGFEMASTHVGEELRVLFNGEAPVNLAEARRSLQLGLMATTVKFAADQLGLTEKQAERILRSKLREQANRTRPHARSPGGQAADPR